MHLEDVPQEEDIENLMVTELPDELRGQVFQSAEELQDRLDVLGIGDLPIELNTDGKALLKTPSDEHNKVTPWLTSEFLYWARDVGATLHPQTR